MSPALRFSLSLALVAGTALGGLDVLHLKPEKKPDSSAPASQLYSQKHNRFQAISSSATAPLSLPFASNLNSLLKQYSSLSPRELRKEINRLSGESQSASCDIALGYLFRKLGTNSPEEARLLLEEADFYCPAPFFAQLMEGWAETDFQGALSYLQSQKKQNSNAREVYETLVRDFSLTEPEKALPWIASLPQQEQELAMPLVFEILISGSPRKTQECLSLLTKEGFANKKLIQTTLRNAAIADWPAAKLWMESLPDHEKKQSMSYAFEVLGKADLNKATSEFRQLPDELKDSMAKSIVNSMYSQSQTSPQKILGWLMDNMDERLHSGLLASKTVENSHFPTNDIIRIVQDMPAGHTRDGALQGLVERLCQEAKKNQAPSFTEALDIAMKVDLAPRKRAAVKNALNAWYETAPDKAKTWVENNTALSPQEKQQYMEYLAQPSEEK